MQPPLAPPALSACSPQQYAVAFLQVLQKYVRRTLQLAVRTPLTSQRAPKSDQTGTRGGGGGAAQPAGTTFSHASRQGHGDNVGEIAQKYQFFLAQTYVCLVSARSDMTGSVWQIKYNIYYRTWRTHRTVAQKYHHTNKEGFIFRFLVMANQVPWVPWDQRAVHIVQTRAPRGECVPDRTSAYPLVIPTTTYHPQTHTLTLTHTGLLGYINRQRQHRSSMGAALWLTGWYPQSRSRSSNLRPRAVLKGKKKEEKSS